MVDSNGLELIVIEPEDFLVMDTAPEVVSLAYLGGQDHRVFEVEVIRLTNRVRKDREIAPLVKNEYLTQSALVHTMDMVENRFISHTGSDGSNVAQRILRTSYQGLIVGENLAMGQRTPKEVVQGWMDSPGHRENLLDERYHDIGVAYVEGDIKASNGVIWRGGYWTQNFGSSFWTKQRERAAIKRVHRVISSITKLRDDDLEIVILDD